MSRPAVAIFNGTHHSRRYFVLLKTQLSVVKQVLVRPALQLS